MGGNDINPWSINLPTANEAELGHLKSQSADSWVHDNLTKAQTRPEITPKTKDTERKINILRSNVLVFSYNEFKK